MRYPMLLAVALPFAMAACSANENHAPPSGGHGPGANPEMQAAMKACSEELGISMPEPGSQQAGGPPPDMQKLDACMEAKGFKRPQGPPPQQGGEGAGAPPPPPSSDSAAAN